MIDGPVTIDELAIVLTAWRDRADHLVVRANGTDFTIRDVAREDNVIVIDIGELEDPR